MLGEHEWVKITICPIEVLEDENGRPVVMLDPAKHQEAEEKSRYGCNKCNEGLEAAYGTACRVDGNLTA